MRRHRTSILAGTLLGLAALPAIANAALPDLVSEPPGGSYLEEYGDGRLLLRFPGYITNRAGAGPLEIRAASPDANDRMTDVSQWRDVTAPGVGGTKVAPPGTAPTVVFEANDSHNHYHLKDAAEYTLWDRTQTAQVAIAQKTEAGFCIEDSEHAQGPGGGPGRYSVGANNFCWQAHDTDGQDILVMGISPGYRDVYPSGLAFQWIDVSRVSPGDYRLAARVDPKNVLTESDEANNGYATRPVTIPGYVARPVAVPRPTGPVTITLSADTFGEPSGTRRFRILSAPEHGTLNVAVGALVPGDAVTYTPAPGGGAPDGFRYAAVETGNRFPVEPAGAQVAIAGAEVSVAIAGAPAELTAGLGAQLSAQVANAPAGVTWSVDGVAGGGGASGTITPGGLYVAPAAPPAGGAVTIRATSTSEPSAFAEARIRIVPVAAQTAAPAASCATVESRRERAGSGAPVRLSAGQLLINQRISQAAVRRANAIEAWLDAGIEGRDLCGGSLGTAELGPGIVAGRTTPSGTPRAASPRPIADAGNPSGRAADVTLSTRQLLINQRISQAAIRRLNGLRARLDGGLTGGDLAAATVDAGALAPDLRILSADTSVPAPGASRTAVAAAAAGDPASVRLTRRQLVINQRIAQAAVRRANALSDELRAGLAGRHFARGTVVARNRAPGARP
ncbi:MAG: lysyl oxidase family protein [Thermoleophilia bacterium]